MAGLEHRDLTSRDRAALESFECPTGLRMPWAAEVLDGIRTRLPDLIDAGRGLAIGGWDGDVLAAVIYATPDRGDPEVWDSDLLAVRTGYQHRHHGEALKRELLRRLIVRGVVLVASYVDFDNEPMIRLNARLGASMKHLRDGSDLVLCRIRLR